MHRRMDRHQIVEWRRTPRSLGKHTYTHTQHVTFSSCRFYRIYFLWSDHAGSSRNFLHANFRHNSPPGNRNSPRSGFFSSTFNIARSFASICLYFVFRSIPPLSSLVLSFFRLIQRTFCRSFDTTFICRENRVEHG